MNQELSIGAIVYDTLTKDIGILIRRYDNMAISQQSGFSLWVWEIYWNHDKMTTYSEGGLLNMIDCQAFLIFGHI